MAFTVEQGGVFLSGLLVRPAVDAERTAYMFLLSYTHVQWHQRGLQRLLLSVIEATLGASRLVRQANATADADRVALCGRLGFTANEAARAFVLSAEARLVQSPLLRDMPGHLGIPSGTCVAMEKRLGPIASEPSSDGLFHDCLCHHAAGRKACCGNIWQPDPVSGLCLLCSSAERLPDGRCNCPCDGCNPAEETTGSVAGRQIRVEDIVGAPAMDSAARASHAAASSRVHAFSPGSVERAGRRLDVAMAEGSVHPPPALDLHPASSDQFLQRFDMSRSEHFLQRDAPVAILFNANGDAPVAILSNAAVRSEDDGSATAGTSEDDGSARDDVFPSAPMPAEWWDDGSACEDVYAAAAANMRADQAWSRVDEAWGEAVSMDVAALDAQARAHRDTAVDRDAEMEEAPADVDAMEDLRDERADAAHRAGAERLLWMASVPPPPPGVGCPGSSVLRLPPSASDISRF